LSSTGNDIVALHAIDKQRTNQIGFYSKILSVAERGLYERLVSQGLQEQSALAQMPFEHFVWLLWSVKESVYKYLKRTTPGLVFSPTGIIVQRLGSPCSPPTNFEGLQWEGAATPGGSRIAGPDEEFYTGTIAYGSTILYFRSKVHAECIATVVSDEENFDHTCWGIHLIDHPAYEHQSKAVRDFVLRRLNALFSSDHAPLRIARSPLGHPIVLKGEEDMQIPLSLAHHERFVAYSFLLRPPASNA
jgi:phosphopantetheinyl transferase (holo-ACP synthase)